MTDKHKKIALTSKAKTDVWYPRIIDEIMMNIIINGKNRSLSTINGTEITPEREVLAQNVEIPEASFTKYGTPYASV